MAGLALLVTVLFASGAMDGAADNLFAQRIPEFGTGCNGIGHDPCQPCGECFEYVNKVDYYCICDNNPLQPKQGCECDLDTDSGSPAWAGDST